jgi:hypothetical protein
MFDHRIILQHDAMRRCIRGDEFHGFLVTQKTPDFAQGHGRRFLRLEIVSIHGSDHTNLVWRELREALTQSIGAAFQIDDVDWNTGILLKRFLRDGAKEHDGKNEEHEDRAVHGIDPGKNELAKNPAV